MVLFTKSIRITSSMTDDTEECSFEAVVEKGNLDDIIRKLETKGLSFDENYHDYSVIIAALSRRRTKIAKFLIKNGFRAYKISKGLFEKTPLHYAIELGDHQLLHIILLSGATPDAAAYDEVGRTPLMIAVDRDDIKAANAIISNVEKTILDEMCILHYSIKCHNDELVKLLLRKGVSPVKKDRENQTAFCIAIKEDRQNLLYLLWATYQEIIENEPDYYTFLGLLFVAVIVDDKDTMVEILEMPMGLTVDSLIVPSEEGWALFECYPGFSLLHCAVKYSQNDIVTFLLENEAKIQVEHTTNSSPLHIALEIKEETVNRNFDHYNANEEILNSLIYYLRYPQYVQTYLNAVNEYGISHFHIVCTQDNVGPFYYFVKNGASLSDSVHLSSPMYKGFSPLHFAVKYMCIKIVKHLLKCCADLEQEAYNKVTPLHVAAKEPSIEIVKLLIQHGADITKQDCDGNTPIHYAFNAKNYEVLDFLLTVHAIIRSNPVNSMGISHFHISCTRDDVSIVAGFLRNGASANDCVPKDASISYVNHNDDIDWRGCSPLHFAAAFNRKDVVQFLLEQDANVEVCDARGFTPFHIACQYSFERFLSTVEESDLRAEQICDEVDRGCKIYKDDFIDVIGLENEFKKYNPHLFLDLCDEEESAIVDWSSNRKDHINIIQLLVEYHSNVNKLDNFGNGPLFYICYFNLRKILSIINDTIKCKHVIRMLLLKSLLKEMCYRRQIIINCISSKVNMEQCYNNGSILHYICVDREYSDIGRLGIMKILLGLGANVNATDEKMQTPLHLATQMKDRKSVEILLDYNADVNCIEAQSLKTPLHVATSALSAESIDIIYLLLKREPDVNMRDLDGKTPLHNLLSKPYDHYVEIESILHNFVFLGADVNIPDKNGRTPLFEASTIISCEVVEDLLGYGADVTVTDLHGVNIYQYVYSQIKTMIVAFQKVDKGLFEIFWMLLEHAIKLECMGLIKTESIQQVWFELKKLVKSLPAHQNQDLDILSNKCCQEIAILKNAKIYNDISLYNLLFQDDHEMIKYINNDVLKAVLQSNSFDETYEYYGYLLKLKFNRGIERSRLLPAAKQSLASITKACLSDCIFEYIFKYLNNIEVRKFTRAMSMIKVEKESAIELTPVRMIKDYSKYSRLD